MRLAGFSAALVFFFLAPTIVRGQQTTTDVDFSQNYSLTAVPLGFGGAYRALADTNAAILLNPAGIAQRKGMVSMGGDFAHSGFMSSTVFGASVIDYKALESFALGLAYDYDSFTAVANDVHAHQVTVAGAMSFGIVNIGASTKGYFNSVNSPFIQGPQGMDVDLGLLVKPIPMLSLGLVGQNLIQGYRTPSYPLQLGLGAALTMQPNARLAIDVVRDFETPAPHKVNAFFGGELRLTEGYYFRGGFGLDKIRDNNFYALGLNAAGPKAGINFTFSQRLNPTQNTYSANLEFYF